MLTIRERSEMAKTSFATVYVAVAEGKTHVQFGAAVLVAFCVKTVKQERLPVMLSLPAFSFSLYRKFKKTSPPDINRERKKNLSPQLRLPNERL